MHKSSIYLPDDLKQALAALAARSGRSEADLIRHAIERLVTVAEPAERDRDQPMPTSTPRRPALVGVGVGPGDPGLVTELARATLRAADRVVVASTDQHSVGRAEMVVRAVAPTSTIVRVAYAIGAGADGRQASLAAVAEAVTAALDAGELVALALIGDPSQWTIFPDLAGVIAASRPGANVSAVPGITSYQAVAASSCVALGRPGAPMVVTDDVAHLDRCLAEAGGSVAIYKASTDGARLKSAAARHDRHDAVVGELIGLPGQRSVALDDASDGPISYLATVVFPAVGPVTTGVAR